MNSQKRSVARKTGKSDRRGFLNIFETMERALKAIGTESVPSTCSGILFKHTKTSGLLARAYYRNQYRQSMSLGSRVSIVTNIAFAVEKMY
jgi:hypothetical protein